MQISDGGTSDGGTMTHGGEEDSGKCSLSKDELEYFPFST